MSLRDQHFNTFREFLELCKQDETLDRPRLIIPEHGAVLTSTLTLEQCFIYLTDKTLRSAGDVRVEGDIYIISFEGDSLSPLLIAPKHIAHSQEIKERCYQMKLDRLKASGARYFICYFRQKEEPWGDPTMNVSFVHPQSFPGEQKEAADKKAEELEQERYQKNDYNVRIVAHLAKDEQDAKEGIFLDD